MNANLATSVYALTASVILAAVSYWLTKAKDYEADLRKLRFDFYREFIVSLAQTPDQHATNADRIRFNTATNALYLVGPSEVLQALRDFRVAICPQDYATEELRKIEFDNAYQRLLWSIRKDLKLSSSATPENLVVDFWSAIPPNKKDAV